MADVYEAVDIRLGRPVAVKVFRPGPGPQTEDRLTAEAVLLAGLQHPGLVTVYDSGREDDRTYLVMQLVEGPTLHSLLQGGPLPERRVAALGAALARALAHVHRADIVHRDVKPSNVLLDAAGDPHLADFGIARLADATRQTAPDVLTGTAAYLAPEQVEGGYVGPPADVYALGLVLLECLKGELEYHGTPLEAAVARLLRAPEIPTWISPDLATLLRAMTAKDSGARPDAEHCAQTLAALNTPGVPPSLPLTAPSAAVLARTRESAATRPARTEGLRTAAASRPAHAGGPAAAQGPAHAERPQHSRRLAVGTALAALSVALGATLALAPGTSGTGDDRADSASAATTPEHPPSTRGTPGAKPSTAPRAATQPEARTSGPSAPAATPTGVHAQPVSRSLPSPDRATPARHTPSGNNGANSHSTSAHRPRDTEHPPHATPNAPGQSNKPSRHMTPDDEE
ncbi:protein kinase [Streptomyces sp. NPDC005706]|uniref:protein kinase domain-containing protein n=1 Tax=Streptomyces sp. NPDC005706 TaxID=3157169 RepID=UPI00340524B9